MIWVYLSYIISWPGVDFGARLPIILFVFCDSLFHHILRQARTIDTLPCVPVAKTSCYAKGHLRGVERAYIIQWPATIPGAYYQKEHTRQVLRRVHADQFHLLAPYRQNAQPSLISPAVLLEHH
jgi:hypothetical protein